MELAQALPTRRNRQARRRRSHPRPTAPAAAASAATVSAQRAGGPQDSALYSCACGYAFEAAVTTSVGCPHCGAEHAW